MTDEEQDRRRALLRLPTQVGSPPNLELGLRRIVQTSTRLVHARYGAIAIRGAQAEIIEFVHEGMPAPATAAMPHPPLGLGVLSAELLKESRGAVRLADLTQSPYSVGFPAGHPPMRSFLGVPIVVGGEQFGSLYFTHSAPGIFSDADEGIARALGLAASAVVENARLIEMAGLREAWLRALAEVTESALSGQSRDRVLDLLTERAKEVSGSDLAVVALSNGSALRIEHAFGENADSFGGASAPAGPLTLAIESGRSTIIEDLEETDLPSVFRPAFRAMLAMPLLAQGRKLGTLGLVWEQPRSFVAEELQAAEDFADSATLAVLIAEGQRERERLAVLEDRDRIARDLHDLVIQRLFAAGMMLQGASRVPEVPESARGRVLGVVDQLDATIQEVRQTIFELRESGSDRPTGLRGRVLREVQSAAALLGFTPVLHFGGAVDSVIDDDAGEQLLAVIREALTNVARHSEATWTQVSLSVGDDEVVLTVSDDGKGIGETTRRSGLANLAERADRLGGGFRIEATEPSTGRGTRLTWRVPLGRRR
jgi:signal transduction histidine kinase